jgi:hypothetical protein
MNAANSLPDNPVALIQQLDADAIRERLDALDRERDALRVLLRAAQRAKRCGGSQTTNASNEVAHASG